MLPLLRADPDLFCVSAWNDNGGGKLVQNPEEVFRTDFFPGLGWMMEKTLWEEVRDRWAVAYWDEFMRRGDVRKGRQCIRPEISRSYTFGFEKGQATSQGQFKNHLEGIRLNDVAVNWASKDLSFLASSKAFDDHLESRLRAAKQIRFNDNVAQAAPSESVEIRILYDDKKDYKQVATQFGLMPDEKEGVRRMSYRGVIPFVWQGRHIFLHTRAWPQGLSMI